MRLIDISTTITAICCVALALPHVRTDRETWKRITFAASAPINFTDADDLQPIPVPGTRIVLFVKPEPPQILSPQRITKTLDAAKRSAEIKEREFGRDAAVPQSKFRQNEGLGLILELHTLPWHPLTWWFMINVIRGLHLYIERMPHQNELFEFQIDDKGVRVGGGILKPFWNFYSAPSNAGTTSKRGIETQDVAARVHSADNMGKANTVSAADVLSEEMTSPSLALVAPVAPSLGGPLD